MLHQAWCRSAIVRSGQVWPGLARAGLGWVDMSCYGLIRTAMRQRRNGIMIAQMQMQMQRLFGLDQRGTSTRRNARPNAAILGLNRFCKGW